MKHRAWKRQMWLLCGLLLVLPVAQAKNPRHEGNQRQQIERAPAARGGYLERDSHNTRNRDPQRNEYRDDMHYDRDYIPQPRHDRDYDYDNRRYDDHDYAPVPRYEPAPRYAPRGMPRGMNLSEAVVEAERRTGGRVLSAEPIDEGGQLFYRVKVLTQNGRVAHGLPRTQSRVPRRSFRIGNALPQNRTHHQHTET